MQVLEMLRSRFNERKTNATETLANAAKKLAAGETVDHAAIENAIVETGTTVDDFEHMVELARRRHGWRSTYEKGTAANTRLEKANATAERERGQFEQIKTAWLERAAELDAEIRAAQKVVDAAAAARTDLTRPQNVPGPVGQQLVDAHRALSEASGRVSDVARQLKEQRELEKSQREWADHKRTLNQSNEHGSADDHEARANRAARRIKELESELKEATAVEAAAAGRLQKAEAAALKV